MWWVGESVGCIVTVCGDCENGPLELCMVAICLGDKVVKKGCATTIVLCSKMPWLLAFVTPASKQVTCSSVPGWHSACL